MTIRLEHSEFHASVADLRGACEAIATARARASGQVGLLLDGGWSGRAASAYSQAWSDWLAASEVVVGSLTSLASTLAAVHASASDVDDTSADSLSRVAGRLG